MEEKDFLYMEEALALAAEAAKDNETPVGCVIEYGGGVIGRGRNCRNTQKNPLRHAELIAINEAAGFMGDWRLEGACIYVTAEPCPMCAGAIIQARIKRLVFGAYNKKAGSAGSVCNLFELPFNHKVEVIGGVLEEKAAALLSGFFKGLRER